MPENHISTESTPADGSHLSRIDRGVLFSIILGLLTAAGMVLLIFQMNRSLELRIEAAEVWSDYQVKIVKASAEEDPNLRQQYTEEQDVLRRHAQDLKQNSSNARRAVKLSVYAALLLLSGTAVAVVGLFVKSRYVGFLGFLLGIVGVALSVATLV